MDINVKFINRLGQESIQKMPLRFYAIAKKALPKQYFPADKEAEKICANIDLEKVPIGTTQKDVEAFEALKGKIKGNKKDDFESMLEAAQKGKLLIDDRPEEEIIKEDLNFDSPAKEVKTPKYSANDLSLMTPDQLEAVINDLPIVDTMKAQLRKMKSKDAKITQIASLL